MSEVFSFPPLAAPHSHILILGSMPGVRSLAAGEYYAHPQNAFWKIMGHLTQTSPTAAYEVRKNALLRSGFAVWDVLKSCVRVGSLDSAIESGSRVPNDFPEFLSSHPHITRICFNGSEAELSFRRHVLPLLGNTALQYQKLPSTSPAHASLNFAQKLALWEKALKG